MASSVCPYRALQSQRCRPQHRYTKTAARQKVMLRCAALAEGVSDSVRQDLDNFITWACANGVEGFGQEGSNACLFVGSDGERGVIAQKDMRKGKVIVQVPLRIALADHPFDQESNQLLSPEAPWSARLACRLLRESARGKDSQWLPYIKVLPNELPTPVHWPWSLLSQIKYQQAANHCFETHWVVESALAKLTGTAMGGDREEISEEDKEAFRWACALVHSRTFATAGQDGGVGVRVMVPVLDMFNHAGDEVRNLLTSRSRPCDNCRWQAVAPENNHVGEWVMQVVATTDIMDGDELCFSYGERSNDDFFVHYGFVPLRNPRDEVILFESVESALDWYALESGLPTSVGGSSGDSEADKEVLVRDLRRIATDAKRAMENRLAEEGVWESASPGATLGPNDPRRLAVRAGCFVTPELLSMFASVAGGRRAHAEAAVARRAWSLLRDWGGEGLRQDLALLAVHSAQHGRGDGQEDSEQRFWEFLLVHYHEAIPRFCRENQIDLDPKVERLQSKPAAEVDAGDLVQEYMSTAGDSSVRPISQEEYLVHTLMANKRMILWDVLLAGKGLALDIVPLGSMRV
eukprot:jgi/Ulvmu1/11324/UM074_0039.1